LRENPATDASIEKVLNTVPVRRPPREEFFRVHPDYEYTVDAPLLDRSQCEERSIYWVAPIMRDELPGELTWVRLITAITKRGMVFLWPAKLPKDGGNSGRAWHQSALEAAEDAKRYWIRMWGNQFLGAYEYSKALGDLGDPQWPLKTFDELVRIAFRDCIIATTEHPVVRDLRGLA
jgi:hypothetical protein